MEIELESNKKKRGTMRSLTTKIINRIEQLIIEDTESQLTDKIEELKDLYDQLIDKEVNLKSLNSKIETSLKDTEIEAEITTSEGYSEKIIKWKSRINRFLKENCSVDNVNVSIDTSNTSQTERIIVKDSQCVKLPKVSLTKFYGEPYLWLDFWNSYQTAIHNNDNLNNVQKFTYLKGLLGGVALNVIQGFALTDQNYKKSVDLLVARFGRDDIVINSHMNKLLNLEPVKNAWNINAFRKLYDELEINIRSLESLNVDMKSVGHLLVPIILKVIPENISLDYNKKKDSKSEFDVKELIKFIKCDLEAREANNLLHCSKGYNRGFNSFNNSKNNDNKGKFIKSNPTASFSTSVEDICCFCKRNHNSFRCEISSPSDKRAILKNEGRCNKCFRRSHISYQCKSKISPCKLCNGKNHHELICFQNDNVKVNKVKNSCEETDLNLNSKNSTVLTNVAKTQNVTKSSSSVLLQTCEVKVHSDTLSENAIVLYDSASMKNFISSALAKRLKLPIIRKEHLAVYTFGNRNCIEKTYDVTEIKISHLLHPEKSLKIEVLISDCITNALFPPPNESLKQVLKRKKIFIPNLFTRKKTADILVGAETYWQIHTGRVQRLTKNLFCVETLFGPCITGVSQENEGFNDYSIVQNLLLYENSFNDEVGQIDECYDLNSQLRRFWEIESLGIREKNENALLDSDILLQFERDIIFENGRYKVKLPFKEDLHISDNFNVAKKRLFSLTRKFKEDLSLFQNYDNIFKEQLRENIIEQVLEEPFDETPIGSMYYMPHHPVIRNDKNTTKVRIVYDASAKERNCFSLNDNLQAGPNLNPNLLTLLLKFRSKEIGIISDIERAFLSISVAEEHRDFQRFLWFDQFPFTDLKIYRSNRVTFGIKSSPFHLAATIKHHLNKYKESHPLAFSALNENLYVDDFIYACDKLNEAVELSKDTKSILKDANMNLRKWKTNSNELREIWKENKIEDNFAEDIVPVKVLGIIWNTMTDEFRLDISGLMNSREGTRNTKRGVLQLSCKLFDPLGMICPFTIRIKILLQKLWERGIDWDERLPDELDVKWNKWLGEIPVLENLSLPRYYLKNLEMKSSEIEFHIFCDASEAAFGAVAYMRYKLKNGNYETSFITSKARVAPIKKMTLPRLELMGTLIGVRILETLRRLFNITNNYMMWSDSTVALSWIRGNSRQWKPFVCNRVCEIQELSNPQNWNHCRGLDNSADIVSRGCTATELICSSKFWKGPDWLRLPKEKWPNIRENSRKEEVNQEKRSTQDISVSCASNEKISLSIERFSSLTRLYRVTAWIRRFLNNCRRKKEDRIKTSLTAEELEEVEEFWLKEVQADNYRLELEMLKKGKKIPKDSKIRDLNPFLSDRGLLVLGGRLQQANMTFYEKHPIILAPKSKLSELIVLNAHERVLHSGINDTLVQIREKYWIPKARQFVKSLLRKCIICKRYNVRSGQQITAPLPDDRIEEAPPFAVTGLDFAGPVYVKNSDEKFYILICTCAVTRALHLELVTKLTTEVFLLAFRRFISRRGLCSVIYSDNAATFKRAELELKNIWKIINHSAVKEFFSSKGIQWKYIVEKAAWWGGFYERMVRSVKSTLRKIVRKTSLTTEELETVLIEIEAVINSRPITFVSSEFQEPRPLTPAHFIIGKRLLSLPSVKLTNSSFQNSTKKVLLKRFNYRERILNQFWIRWKHDYLLNLRSANLVKPGKSSSFKVGDIVLIDEQNIPRSFWRLGKIVETFTGRDNKIRACAVKTEKSIIRRPVQLLYNLELD